MNEVAEWIVSASSACRRARPAADTPLTLEWDPVGRAAPDDVAGLAREHHITVQSPRRYSEDVASDTRTSYLYVTDSLVTGKRAERFARDALGVEGGVLDLGVVDS